MRLVTIELLRQHCLTDGDDDEMLAIYGNAAESAVQREANRNFYLSADDMDVAVSGIEDAMAVAYSRYDAAILAAARLADPRRRVAATNRAETILGQATLAQEMIVHGLVLDLPLGWPETVNLAQLSGPCFDVVAAVLLTAGHFYRNRENVISGQGAAAVQVPQTAENLISKLRWIGPL